MRGQPQSYLLFLSLIAVAVGIGLASSSAGEAHANGGGTEVFRGRQGSYELGVGVQPEKPTVGIVHFSVAPLNFVTSLPVTDARVLIVAGDDQGKDIYEARAVNTPDARGQYEANIAFDSSGVWSLRVEIETDDLGQATFSFPFNVEDQSITPSTAGAVVFAGVTAVLIGGTVYLWWTSRRKRRAAAG